ncbi:DUF4924 family protein [Porphyromonas endodontalis]|uniref:DUF4924 family protein n=1 Tax=Porphyromonas endodontalis TaxID=28124 RepID=UPI003FA06F11
MSKTISLSQMREQNPAEYLIYMWYLESLVRAMPRQEDFDSFLLRSPEQLPVIGSLREVLPPLRKEMLVEDIMEQPNRHTATLTALLQELEQLHKQLLADAGEEIYEELYTAVLTAVVEIRRRSGGVALGEVEAAIVALYGYTFLKQTHQETTKATREIMMRISVWLKVLGEKYTLQKSEKAPLDGDVAPQS